MTTEWLTPQQHATLMAHLGDLPELGALASTTLHRERLGGSGSRSVPGSRPPLNLPALALATLRDLPWPDEWPTRDGGIVWVDARGHVHAGDPSANTERNR